MSKFLVFFYLGITYYFRLFYENFDFFEKFLRKIWPRVINNFQTELKILISLFFVIYPGSIYKNTWLFYISRKWWWGKNYSIQSLCNFSIISVWWNAISNHFISSYEYRLASVSGIRYSFCLTNVKVVYTSCILWRMSGEWIFFKWY